MEMTEDEAKTKWCPMVRSSDLEKDVDNCYIKDRNPTYSRCIASDCMMWRLSARHYLDDVPPKSPIQGYCGLAGTAGTAK